LSEDFFPELGAGKNVMPIPAIPRFTTEGRWPLFPTLSPRSCPGLALLPGLLITALLFLYFNAVSTAFSLIVCSIDGKSATQDLKSVEMNSKQINIQVARN
jgi:hypothetical protein